MKILYPIQYLFLFILIIYSFKSEAQVFNWAKKIDTKIAVGYTNSIAPDIYGNIYMAGFFKDTISFGNYQLSSVGEQAGYIAKFNNEGNL